MAKITQLSQLDLNATYSYADYLNWTFDEAIELIKGKISLMSPAPNVKHQDISMNLTRPLSIYFQHKKCRVYAAPFDVRLYDSRKSILASQDIHTVVQPDLCVICDLNKLDQQGCNGAPDWIIEILVVLQKSRLYKKYTIVYTIKNQKNIDKKYGDYKNKM